MLNGGKAQPAALSNANLPRPAILAKPRFCYSTLTGLHCSRPFAQPASGACVNRELTNSAAKAASLLAIRLPLGAPTASACTA
jgi:hypothetical protein